MVEILYNKLRDFEIERVYIDEAGIGRLVLIHNLYITMTIHLIKVNISVEVIIL